MHIVAIGWMYVVLMMSIAEETALAGIMSFLCYGVVPLGLILYFSGARRRRARRVREREDGAPPAA